MLYQFLLNFVDTFGFLNVFKYLNNIYNTILMFQTINILYNYFKLFTILSYTKYYNIYEAYSKL